MRLCFSSLELKNLRKSVLSSEKRSKPSYIRPMEYIFKEEWQLFLNHPSSMSASGVLQSEVHGMAVCSLCTLTSSRTAEGALKINAGLIYSTSTSQISKASLVQIMESRYGLKRLQDHGGSNIKIKFGKANKYHNLGANRYQR